MLNYFESDRFNLPWKWNDWTAQYENSISSHSKDSINKENDLIDKQHV
jgi:hypothetical protein